MDIIQNVGILDLIFIVILAVSILIGLIRGVIREILSLVGLGASIYLAFTFADSISKTYVSQFLEDPRISYIVTFVLIIVGTLFFVTLINLFFSQLLKASGLSFINRFFGAVFGAIRGAIICSIIVLVISFIPNITEKPWWQASSLAPTFKQLTKVTFKYLPKEVTDYFNSAKASATQAANELIVPRQQAAHPSNTQQPATPPQAPQQPTEQSAPSVARPTGLTGTTPETEQPKPPLILESYQEQ